MARIYRKIERTADEKAEIERIRNAPKTGAATGERIASEDLNAVLHLIAALRRRREELGMDQVELAERMGIEASALCRLETFKIVNPTIWTLLRWAEALDCRVGLDLRVAAKSTPEAKTA